MSVPAGTRFGPYEIDALIGEGGMGRVYRARDTRLDPQRRGARDAHRGVSARADELVAQLGDRPQPTWGRVWYHLFTRDLDAAAHWFDRMIDDRDPFALVYARAPVTEPLHAHPRWPALAQRMRLPAQ